MKLGTRPSRRELRRQLPPGPRIPGALQLVATWKRPSASLERLRQQYGQRITAFVLYLLHYQLLPEDRLAELMAGLFGVHEAGP